MGSGSIAAIVGVMPHAPTAVFTLFGTGHETLRAIREDDDAGFVLIAFHHLNDFLRRWSVRFRRLQLIAGEKQRGGGDEQNLQHWFSYIPFLSVIPSFPPTNSIG